MIESVEEYLQLFKTNYGAIDANWVSAIEYNQLYPQPDYESSEDSDKHLEELNAWQEKQQKQLPHPEIMKALVSLEDELWQPTRDWGKSNNCWVLSSSAHVARTFTWPGTTAKIPKR